MSGNWCILRTSGRHTLRLAQTLAEDGFEVWTPREVKPLQARGKSTGRRVTLPIMPSYVFARLDHLFDLHRLAEMPVKPRRNLFFTDDNGKQRRRPAHADFSVMRFHDSIPTIADAHLQALRVLEAKRQPRKKVQRLPAGVEVRVKSEGGSFAGMCGKVERSNEATTLVCFDGRLSIKLPTSLLSIDDVRAEATLHVRKAA